MLFARWLSCIFMFAVTKTHRCSRGVDPFDSVETKDPVFSASRSLVIRRAQQPKRLVTLVSRPYATVVYEPQHFRAKLVLSHVK